MNTEEILEGIPDKQFRWKDTTSLKWKEDLLMFAADKNFKNVLEIGTNYGWTSYLLSYMAEQVYTVEKNVNSFEEARKICEGRENITFILGDAYNDTTYKDVPNELDAVVVDCIHTYQAVEKDILRAIKYKAKDKPIYLIFDDYSHPKSAGVGHAIDDFRNKKGFFERYLGHEKGHEVNRNDGSSFILTGNEGIILRYE